MRMPRQLFRDQYGHCSEINISSDYYDCSISDLSEGSRNDSLVGKSIEFTF